MSAIIHKRISFTDSFRSFHQHQRYEDYVFLILQRSKNLFDGTQFTRIKQQSNGECDFLYEDNIKFDVKLLLENSQGRLLGDRKNDVATWVEEMLSEQTEFGNCIGKRDFSKIRFAELDADIYVLRDACYHREYIPAPEIKEIFFFETTL